MRFGHIALGTIAVLGLACCGGGDTEPTEDEMKSAMLDVMNHPPGVTTPGDPVTISTFKKGACDKPTPQGFNCTFTVVVASTNMAAAMFNNVPQGVFYKDKDSGAWKMRPPF